MYSWIWTEVLPSLTLVFLLIHHNLHKPGKHGLDYIFPQPATTDQTHWILSGAPPCTSPATGLESPPLSPSGPVALPNTPPWPCLCSCICFHHGHLPHGTKTLHLPVSIIGLWALWGQGCVWFICNPGDQCIALDIVGRINEWMDGSPGAHLVVFTA